MSCELPNFIHAAWRARGLTTTLTIYEAKYGRELCTVRADYFTKPFNVDTDDIRSNLKTEDQFLKAREGEGFETTGTISRAGRTVKVESKCPN